MRLTFAFSLTLALAACGSVANDSQPDAKQPDACVPQDDLEFCSAVNACETHTGMDNCGATRTVDCGNCTGGKGCVVGTCQTPVCTSFDYATSSFPNMSRAGVEDSIGGATPDAQTILYVQTAAATGCGIYQLIVADETSPGTGVYTQRDVSRTLTALGLFNGQDSYAITADGLSIIALSTDRKTLKMTKRSAINMVDFGTPTTIDFANISPQTTANNKVIISPTYSADGLELWYTLQDVTAGSNEVFSSIRTSTSVPFPVGTPAPAPVSSYPLVSGISADRLTLFVFATTRDARSRG